MTVAAPTYPLIALDVDGVLTDGSIMLDDDGREIKRFNVRDGLAITTWLRLGLHAGIITRRAGRAVEHRMRELGVPHVVQGCKDKREAVAALAEKCRVPLAQAAFIGDDWPDLPAMRAVGFPIAVADAAPEVKAVAKFVTIARGGRGAVREAVEHLLVLNGLHARAASFFD
ncbi:MAG: HAD-IIIA family hydrolase [Phycisphaeraceae bacterium]|nr:HAD-IIIA family hydrolase [Phycisphaeraceae bacterium]